MTFPTSRADAQALGVGKYDTGQTCKNGHSEPRYTLSGTCAGCLRDSQARINAAYHASLDPLRHERKRFGLSTRVTAFRVPTHELAALGSIAASLLAYRFPTLDGHVPLTVDAKARGELGGTVRADFLHHTEDAKALSMLCDDALARFGLSQVQRASLLAQDVRP